MRTLRVGSRYGPVFDTPVDDSFRLDAFIGDLRNKGYWFNGSVYVPHDTISFVTIIPASVRETIVDPQNLMGIGETRQ